MSKERSKAGNPLSLPFAPFVGDVSSSCEKSIAPKHFLEERTAPFRPEEGLRGDGELPKFSASPATFGSSVTTWHGKGKG